MHSLSHALLHLTSQIYVQGLPPNVTEAQLAEHFGAIGVIKKDKKTAMDKIHIYREGGRCKGDATVTYEDPDAAEGAVDFFDKQDFLGQPLTVTVASRGGEAGAAGSAPAAAADAGQQQGPPERAAAAYGGDARAPPSWAAPSGRGGGGDGYGGGPGSGGPPPGAGRPGDWACPKCSNHNFARRDTCNRCQTPKPGGGGGGGGGGYQRGPGGHGGGYGAPPPPQAYGMPPPPQAYGSAPPPYGAPPPHAMAAPGGPQPHDGDWACELTLALMLMGRQSWDGS